MCRFSISPAGELQFDWSAFDRAVQVFIDEGVIGRIEGAHLGGRAAGWNSPIVASVHRIKDGKIETVQKMDKRNFARVRHKRHTGGFYANIIFEAKSDVVAQLRSRFSLDNEVFRVLFTGSPPPPPKPEPVPVPVPAA